MIFIMIVVIITGIFMAINYLLIYTLGFLYISNSGSADAQLPGCFHISGEYEKIWKGNFLLLGIHSLYTLSLYKAGDKTW